VSGRTDGLLSDTLLPPFVLRMISSENRFTLFGIMHYLHGRSGNRVSQTRTLSR
jgi:hypothetical protein